MHENLFPAQYRALIVGSGGAIGAAFVQAFQSDPRCERVVTITRNEGFGFDLQTPESFTAQAARCLPHAPFHVVVDATGALSADATGPEKSLSALHAQQAQTLMQINAIGPLLLLETLRPLLAMDACLYAKLSARVGSISDNQLGGWYSYRASKAALNALLQTAALELQRKHRQLRVVALQPGTVDSRLSKPFSAHAKHLLTAEESVAGMMQALSTLPIARGAQFIDYKGEHIPW